MGFARSKNLANPNVVIDFSKANHPEATRSRQAGDIPQTKGCAAADLKVAPSADRLPTTFRNPEPGTHYEVRTPMVHGPETRRPPPSGGGRQRGIRCRLNDMQARSCTARKWGNARTPGVLPNYRNRPAPPCGQARARPQAALLASSVGRLSITESMSPNSLAASDVMKLSRSSAFSMASKGWPVCFT